MVGDLFMALPAVRTLAQSFRVQVICRPDCVEILRQEGLETLAFDNVFFHRPGPGSFLATLRQAWALRGKLGAVALDFDADPRTAFWLRVAGVSRAISYVRPYALLFDRRFPIAEGIVHQADKNMAVAQGFLGMREVRRLSKAADRREDSGTPASRPAPVLDPATGPWILSCFTRKDTKNWPLDRWSDLLERLAPERIPLLILDAPDGDAAFRGFRDKWSPKVGFIRGPLAQIAGYVRAAAGVITTDNFLGHMAGYYGKPVLWINGSSDPGHVMPQGPRTRCVQIEPMPCRPCGHRCVNPRHKECLVELRSEEVWKAFKALTP
jgi:ADP-heptose:LPS heptosyltransferase